MENTIKCIIKDRNGFIWFGTSTGLNRYDGYEFEGMLKERTFNIVWVTKDKQIPFKNDIPGDVKVVYYGAKVTVLKK